MKGALILAVVLGISGTAFAQESIHPKDSPQLLPLTKEFSVGNPLLERLARQSAAKTAEIAQLGSAAPIMAPPTRLPPSIVINYGQGGRVAEHMQRFAEYQRAKAKVELRGPCYSACTLVLAYVEPERLCIAPNAFMAFHAIRSIEYGEIMVGATHSYYESMPPLIQAWISDNGGWQNLPLNGYWTLYARQLWMMGYPKCS